MLDMGEIGEDTGLGVRTVRSIVNPTERKGRAMQARLQRRAHNKLAKAEERARQKMRDALPRRINAALKQGAKLRKRTKGLG